MNEELIMKAWKSRNMETQGQVKRGFGKGWRKTETIQTPRDDEGSGNTWKHHRNKFPHNETGRAKLNTMHMRQVAHIPRLRQGHGLTPGWG